MVGGVDFPMNQQSAATQRYHEKIGLVTRSYKLDKEISERFKEACAAAGISQRQQLEKMMLEFIDGMKQGAE